MDIATLKAAFGQWTIFGCALGFVSLAVLAFLLWLRKVPSRVAIAAKRLGWVTVAALFGLGVWAMGNGYPTLADKELYAQDAAAAKSVAPLFVDLDDSVAAPLAAVGSLDDDAVVAETAAPGSQEAESGVADAVAIRPAGTLTADDYALGFVLAQVVTNETFDFSAPADAQACEDWLAFGAASDWFRVQFPGGWSFPFGTNVLDALTVFSLGTVRPRVRDRTTFISPLQSSLGIVPAANWRLLDVGARPSRFWHCLSPSNTFVMTWQNALLGRDAARPVSFQAELYPNGCVTFRYDLSRIGGSAVTNVTVGIGNGAVSNALHTLHASVTSLRWARLDPSLAEDPDPDGDGLDTAYEVLTSHTDPYAADSDLDGLSDSQEIFIYHTDPNDPHSANGHVTDIYGVEIGDADPFSHPTGSTNTILEHVFYSGTASGAVSYPQSSEEYGILRVTVTGTGSGELYVGDRIVPLVGGSASSESGSADFASVAAFAASDGDTASASATTTTSSAQSGSNTLLLSIGKGVRQDFWFRKPDGLDIAIDSDDLLIGEIPSVPYKKGWIAFPHTDATPPCIHDLDGGGKTMSLVHGEEFEGLAAEWSSESKDVRITNVPPVSAEVRGSFAKRESRAISYTVVHPKMLNRVRREFSFPQSLRFCPQVDEEDCVGGAVSNSVAKEVSCRCGLGDGTACSCCSGEWCHCWESGCCPCNEGTSDALPDGEDAAAEYARLGGLPSASDVLHLYRDNADRVLITVPTGSPCHCCECPDHWRTSYAAVVSRSPRLMVVDDAGSPFSRTNADCTVTVSGVLPSASPGDASVCFATNGVVVRPIKKYTVLGVAFETVGNRPPLRRYDELSPSFGYPITVNTNLESAAMLTVRSDVLLPGGVVRLALENVTGEFQIWLPEWYDNNGNLHAPELVLDSSTRAERYLAMSAWRNAVRRHNIDARVTALLMTSSRTGHADLVIEYATEADGTQIRDSARQRVTAVPSALQCDYNHDGSIDGKDDVLMMGGRPYRFWFNSETYKGDKTDDLVNKLDVVASANSSDLQVNGRYDLVNFFAVAIRIAEFRRYWGDIATYRLRSAEVENGCHFCLVNVPWNHVGSLQTNDCASVNGDNLCSAGLTALSHEGVVIPRGVIAELGISGGVAFAEAACANCQMELEVLLDGKQAYSFIMPMQIADIREMYRWINLRNVCGDSSGEPSRTASPTWYPDGECDGRNFVFVHGYNVNSTDARTWADAMFKRLWHAGSTSMFTAVDWCGDSSQFQSIFHGKVSPDYYINVEHAFASAEPMAKQLAQLPGYKVMLAHSLGNMLTSSAAVDHALDYRRYYMLNAAVPVEAYDVTSFTSNMVDSAFENVDSRFWSSNWYALFGNDADVRSSVKWRGIFSAITNAVNCYSPTEDVLENASPDGYGESWAQQELLKGTSVWHGINVLPCAGVSCEGGWGINSYYAADPRYYAPGIGYYHDAFTSATSEAAIQHPLFTPFDDDALHSTNIMATMTIELKRKLLADAIPATSFAAGCNPIPTFDTTNVNLSYEEFMANGWPRTNWRGDYEWQHSDIKNIAYYYLSKLYGRIVNESKANH